MWREGFAGTAALGACLALMITWVKAGNLHSCIPYGLNITGGPEVFVQEQNM